MSYVWNGLSFAIDLMAGITTATRNTSSTPG